MTKVRLLTGLVYGGIALWLHLWGRYRSWWWYDNVAHLSAGISLGSLYSAAGTDRTQTLLATVGVTVAWEIVEYLHGAYPWGEDDLPDRAAAEDTLLDSILVMLGVWLATSNGGDS